MVYSRPPTRRVAWLPNESVMIGRPSKKLSRTYRDTLLLLSEEGRTTATRAVRAQGVSPSAQRTSRRDAKLRPDAIFYSHPWRGREIAVWVEVRSSRRMKNTKPRHADDAPRLRRRTASNRRGSGLTKKEPPAIPSLPTARKSSPSPQSRGQANLEHTLTECKFGTTGKNGK